MQAFLSLLEFISTKQPQEKGFYVGTQTPLYTPVAAPLTFPLVEIHYQGTAPRVSHIIIESSVYLPGELKSTVYKTTLIQFVQLWLLHPEYSIM